jgi:hypothetical protein
MRADRARRCRGFPQGVFAGKRGRAAVREAEGVLATVIAWALSYLRAPLTYFARPPSPNLRFGRVFVVPNGNSYTDAMTGDRSSGKGVLAPVSKAMERGAGPAHLHLRFGQPAVDLLVYLCCVRSDEGLDLHFWSQSEKSPGVHVRRG